MRYLGIDVHSSSIVFHLLDETGQTLEHGKIATSEQALSSLVGRLGAQELLVGQEVGTLSHFVYDVLTALGVKVLSFNAYHLRMIASSRKKTDKRDAYWIAKALQSGMMPHPVYIPTGEVRALRALLSQRAALVDERRRWLLRARSYLVAAGHSVKRAPRSVKRLIALTVSQPEGLDAKLYQSLLLCQRMDETLTLERERLQEEILARAKPIEAITRLKTIPSVGDWVAVMLYAWIGQVERFGSARELASYVGLVPSVHQSGDSTRHGGITKLGSPQLRSVLVQAAHVLMFRCRAPEAAPLQAIAARIHKARARRKIAVVAAARHILRIAYYILRDGSVYDPTRLSHGTPQQATDQEAIAPSAA